MVKGQVCVCVCVCVVCQVSRAADSPGALLQGNRVSEGLTAAELARVEAADGAL